MCEAADRVQVGSLSSDARRIAVTYTIVKTFKGSDTFVMLNSLFYVLGRI